MPNQNTQSSLLNTTSGPIPSVANTGGATEGAQDVPDDSAPSKPSLRQQD